MNKWKNSWKSPEYNAWMHMIHRCYNEKDKSFKHYGMLGVKVCDRWKNSFDAFVEDMGKRPSNDYSIDRIDSSGDYCPENCRWADRITQANNKRSNKRVDVFGESMTAREISIETGIPIRTVKSRIDAGMPADKIISSALHMRKNWEHGTLYGYIKIRCRCDLCKKAKSDNAKASYAKKRHQLDQLI